MKKFTKEKGITLIALVITIIVMLILVAVTISVAINGGLFSKANDAAKKMQIEADREELQAALLDTMDSDGKVHLTDGTDHAGNTVYGVEHYLTTDPSNEEYWEHTEGSTTFTKHHKNGDENAFTVTINANGGFTVTYVENSNSVDDTTADEEATVEEIPKELYAYVFPNGSERILSEILGEDENNDYNYGFFDTEGILEDTPYYEGADWYITDEGMMIGMPYLKYKNAIYKFRTFEDYTSGQITDPEYGIQKLDEVVVSTSTETPGIGSKITYDDQDWIVMYVNGNEIQMVSEKVMYYDEQDFYLGYEDSYYETNGWPTNITTEFDKAVYSYNNAIETLNKACESLVDTTPNYVTKVRSIGSNINDYAGNETPIENTTTYTSAFLSNHSQSSKIDNVGKGTDTNYLTDYERLICLGLLKGSYSGDLSNGGDSYWLASRYVKPSPHTDFAVRCVECGELYFYHLWEVEATGRTYGWMWRGWIAPRHFSRLYTLQFYLFKRNIYYIC